MPSTHATEAASGQQQGWRSQDTCEGLPGAGSNAVTGSGLVTTGQRSGKCTDVRGLIDIP